MPVAAVFENIEAGATIDESIEQFDVTREQITAVLDEISCRMLVLSDHVNQGEDA